MANTIQLRRGTSDVVLSGGSATSANIGEPVVFLPTSGDQKFYIAKSDTAGEFVWMGAPITTDETSSSATKLMTASAIQAAIDAEDTLAEMGDTDISSAASGHILVHDGSDSFDNVAVSGDATLAANGALTIANNAVEQAMIADDAVGADQLAANAVVSASIVDGTIATGDLADDAITAAKIADNAVGAAALNISGNGTSGQILQTDGDGSFSYTNAASANDSTLTITAGDGLKTGGTFTTNQSSNSSVTLDVDVSDFAGNGLEADGSENLRLDISGLSNTLTAVAQSDFVAVSDESATADETKKITFSDFEDEIFGNVSSDATIAAGGAMTIANNAITQAKVADDAIGADELAASAVVTASMVDDAVTAAKLASDAVVTASIVDLNVTTAKIAADAITGAKIADDAINSEHYTDGSIDTAHIANDAVTGDKLSNDVTIANDLTVSGDLTVNGDTTTVNTATLSVEDPLIILANGNSADSIDTGFYAKYVESSTTKYAGVFRDASASGDPFTFFDSLTAEPTTTVNSGHATFDLADISAGGITAADGFTGNLTGNVTGNASGSSGSCTGNAATATKLAATKTINGTAFDGSSNITLGNDSVTNAMMADDAIDTAQLADSAVNTARLADDAVTAAKLASDAVVTASIVDANVTAAKLASNAVTQAKVADDAIGADELAANAVVNASIASNAAIDMDKLDGDSLGTAITDFAQDDLVILSDTSDSGNLVKITASNFEDAIFGNVSGDATIAAGGALTIANTSVTNAMLAGSITNAKLATSTISGISLGSNLNNLTVDDTTVELNSGTTFNGGAARTISAKTAAISDGGTALATADQIHTFVSGFNIDGGAI